MKITEIYKSIIKYLGLESDNNGFIYAANGDKKEFVVINGLKLVLPTKEQLKAFDPNETIIFHPLMENIFQSESPVIDKIKNIINIRLNYTIGAIIQALLTVVASPEFHSKLNPEQAELLVKIKDADEKSVLNFINIMLNGIKTKASSLFINIYLRKGGVYKDKKYPRVGIVTFPFYKELIDNKVDKIRVKDKETYKAIMEFILPEITESEVYNYGSNSNVAPYIDAIMMTSANIASRLNDILNMYKDFIDDADKLIFSHDWIDYFNNLEQLMPEIRKVPMQYGNDGNITIDNTPEQPVNSQQPMNMGMVYPQQPNYQQQPMQQPMQPPTIKKSNKGLDFKSLMQVNPNIGYNQNVMNPLIANQLARQQPMMPMQGQPYPPNMMNPNMVYPQQPMMPMQGQPYPQQPMMPMQGQPYPPNMMNPNMVYQQPPMMPMQGQPYPQQYQPNPAYPTRNIW